MFSGVRKKWISLLLHVLSKLYNLKHWSLAFLNLYLFIFKGEIIKAFLYN